MAAMLHEKSEVCAFLNQPLKIGNKTIQKRLVLAPMSGLGHVAFRELVAEYGGCGLLFTGMCSAKALPTENRQVSPVFSWRDAELSELVCQVFGSDPGVMATAAKRVADEGFFGVDINFGCSVAAICKRSCGAAVLKTPDRAVQIVKAVRKAVSLPLFVKFRTGWKDDPVHAVNMAKRFEDAGADALTFHPRVAPDRRSRPPKWAYITQVKQAVSIPVFGNGEVFSFSDCKKMITMTGCDGVSLGRIAVAMPWVFSRWTDGFVPGPDIYRHNARQLLDLLTRHNDPPTALRMFKKHARYMAANFKYGHVFYKKIQRAADIQAMETTVRTFFDNCPKPTGRPNMNLFR